MDAGRSTDALARAQQHVNQLTRKVQHYQSALLLAQQEIEQRSLSMTTLTNFMAQASQTSNLSEFFKLALTQSLQVPNAPVGAIVLIEPKTKELILTIQQGLKPALREILKGHQIDDGAFTLMPHLVSGAGVLLEKDTIEDPWEEELLAAGGLASLVSLPIQFGRRMFGALLIGLQNEGRFTPAELYFLLIQSQQLAILLDNFRLRQGLWVTAEVLLSDDELTQYRQHTESHEPVALSNQADDVENLLAAKVEADAEVARQDADLQILNSIADLINRTLDLPKTLQSAVALTKDMLHSDAAWLYLHNGNNTLELNAHLGLSTNYTRGMSRIDLNDGLEGYVARENKSLSIASTQRDQQHKQKIWVDKEKLSAIAAVPITRPEARNNGSAPNTQVIGVLLVGKRDSGGYDWTPRDTQMLTAIANQLAPAIDNAHLHAQVQEQEIKLRAGNEVLTTINDMLLEKNAFLEGVIQEDVSPILNKIVRLTKLLAVDQGNLSGPQRQSLLDLYTVVDDLQRFITESGLLNDALSGEINRVIAPGEAIDEEKGTVTPIRLKKAS